MDVEGGLQPMVQEIWRWFALAALPARSYWSGGFIIEVAS